MRGDGRIYRRGSKYWIEYRGPHSKQIRESAGETEQEAKKLLKARMKDVIIHKAGLRVFQGPKQERITVTELLNSYEKDCEIRQLKGLAQIRSHLKHPQEAFCFGQGVGGDIGSRA